MRTEQLMDCAFLVTTLFAVTCLLIYVPRMAGWFAAFRPQKRICNEKMNRIAVIIPAKNEGKIIDDILSSLQKQTYDHSYFDVHAIVQNKEDITVSKVRKMGGYVYIANNQSCKGDALDYCLKKILIEKPNCYDGFFIVDADCLLAPDCLEEMNNAMGSGAMIVQAKKLVKNYLSKNPKANSLVSSCNGLIWTMIDDMGNRYKAEHQLTGMTIGTGILLTNALVKELGGWPYRQTLTEDMELMNDCAIKGYTTFYYSYANIYVEESTDLHVTNLRRTRWLTGLIDSKMIYNEGLMRKLMEPKERRNIYFVTALWPVFYYIGSLTVFASIHIVAASLLILKKDPLAWKAMAYAGLGVGMIYVSFLVLTGMCMIVERKNIRLSFVKKIMLFFAHPVFYMGYIPIVANAFLKRNTESWEAIDRMELDDENYVEDMEKDECYKVRCFKKNCRM